jgi:hypothetical protein
MEKSALREYFIQRAKCSTLPHDLSEKLDRLSIFTGEKKELNMKQFWDELFSSIVSIDLINYAEVYIRQKQHFEKLDIIVAIQIWAKTAWNKGIETVDINKIIIAFILIDRLFLLPDVDLNWDFNEEIKEKWRVYLKRLPERITLDVSTNLPERASYSDRKFHNDYKAALEKNDHKGVFTFLSAISHGIGFSTQFDYFIQVTSKLSVIVDTYIFAENLSKFTPYGIRYYFEYLNSKQIVEVLTAYKALEPLPLLIGVIQIVNPHGGNQFDSKLLVDNEFIKMAALAVEKIAQRITTSNIYKYITDCSNIFMNELWHCIFSAFIAKNYQYHNHYLDAIDFSYNVGEHSFNGFIAISNDIDDLDKFSCMIYDRYFLSIVGKHSNRLIHFTSYYQYLSQAIFVLSDKSHHKFLENLERQSIELKRGIYSWEKDNWDMLFTKWVFWLLSSKDFIERIEFDKEFLKTTYELINDIRITDVLQIDSISLITLLENPGRVGSIALPVANTYGDEKTIISWDLSNAIY